MWHVVKTRAPTVELRSRERKGHLFCYFLTFLAPLPYLSVDWEKQIVKNKHYGFDRNFNWLGHK